VEKVISLKGMDARKVALPQDEFINTDILCDFINEMALDVVFSVAPSSEWPKIYSTVDRSKVQFYQVLPGYLDEKVLEKIERLEQIPHERTIDIGYRTAGRPYPWFGRHGYLKQKVAEVILESGPQKGLTIDISTSNEEPILGDQWYDFLLRCKYTIGTEGGTSILDLDGSIHKKTTDYIASHPEASFKEVEAACFPNLDGTFKLFAISPRHLEACAVKTCQILTTGEYNGILEPGRHYIELKSDFSNLEQVLDLIEEDKMRAELTEQAYEEIVASGRYTYKEFVDFVLEHSLPYQAVEQSSLSH